MPPFTFFNRLRIGSNGEIQRNPISSENLASQGYDPRRRVLEIEFIHLREVYRYFGVSRADYDAMMNAHTPGQYFYHFIRLRFPYVRIQ